MQRFAIAYVVSGAVFVAIDLLWLSLVMSKLFKAQMPQLILEQPNWRPPRRFMRCTRLASWPSACCRQSLRRIGYARQR